VSRFASSPLCRVERVASTAPGEFAILRVFVLFRLLWRLRALRSTRFKFGQLQALFLIGFVAP